MRSIPMLFMFVYIFLWVGMPRLNSVYAQASNIKIANITPTEVKKLIEQESAILVDVRESDEIKLGMAQPARWMPLSRMKDGDRMFSDFLDSLPKEKLIVLYCAAGKRAAQAQVELKKKGFRTANMGGFSEWLKVCFPTRIPD